MTCSEKNDISFVSAVKVLTKNDSSKKKRPDDGSY